MTKPSRSSRPSALARDGAALLKMGLFREAVRSFEQGLEKEPGDLTCMLGLARALLALGRDEQAQAVLQRFLALRPNHPEAVSHLGRLRAMKGDARALEALRTLSNRADAQYPEHYNLGIVLLGRGDLDEAEAAFQRALAKVPGSPYALTYLGSIARQRGDLARAIDCYKQAAARARGQSYPLLLLARAYAAGGRVEAAIQALRQAVSRTPEAPELYQELAKLLLAAGQPRAAVQAAVDLRLRRPKDANALYLHGLALLAASQGEDARRVLEEALQAAPRSWEVRLLLARIEEAARRPERAQALLEEAVALAPGEPGPATDLSAVYLRQPGGDARAREVLAPALQAHPDEPRLNLNMALALKGTAPEQAAAHARRARASSAAAMREQAERLLSSLGG